MTQLCIARKGAEEDSGAQGRHPPASFLRKIAGLSRFPASPEQEAQRRGLNRFARQSDTVLLEEEVLEVEVVDRHPPRFLRPISLLLFFTPALWAPETEVEELPPPPGQLAACSLKNRHLTNLQQPQVNGWVQSMVQVWSGLGKPPGWEEQGERGRP